MVNKVVNSHWLGREIDVGLLGFLGKGQSRRKEIATIATMLEKGGAATSEMHRTVRQSTCKSWGLWPRMAAGLGRGSKMEYRF